MYWVSVIYSDGEVSILDEFSTIAEAVKQIDYYKSFYCNNRDYVVSYVF